MNVGDEPGIGVKAFNRVAEPRPRESVRVRASRRGCDSAADHGERGQRCHRGDDEAGRSEPEFHCLSPFCCLDGPP